MRSLLYSRQEQTKSHQVRFVRERIRKLEMEMAKIRTVKEAFLESLSITNKTIEEMTRNISREVQQRGEVLKHRLRDIGKEKMSEWDRQLELCLKAEKDVTDNIPGVLAIFAKIDESIGFIDSGDVRFEEDMTILTKIKNFGTVSLVHRPIVGEDRMVFSQPLGVCSDPTGRILVSDGANNRIQVFNEFGDFIFQFGESGSRPGEFLHPSGIAIDKKLRILVSDTRNHRIQVFTYRGGFVTAFGQKGTSVGQFRSPQDIAVDEHCDIAVSDTQNRRVQLFGPHGGFITQFCFGPDVSPWRIAFSDAFIIVIDAQNHRLLIINKYFTTKKDGSEGTLGFNSTENGKEVSFGVKKVNF